MGWYVDLPTQVRRILPRRSGGTGNGRGWATGVVVAAVNRGAATIPVGSAVRVITPNGVVMVEDADATDVYGVTVGRYADDGETFAADEVEQNEVAAVMVAGTPRVRVDDAATGSVVIGAYVVPSGTPGAVDASATPTAAAFGRFTMGGQPGDLVAMRLGGGGGAAGGAALTDGQVEATFQLPTGGDEVETRVPYDGTITGWVMTGDDPAGSATVDVYLADLVSYPPGAGDSITGGAPPTLSAADTATGDVTGWSTALARDQRLVSHVVAVSGHQRLTVSLAIERSS